ncbi:MAG: hypothetical protein FWD44_00975 [Oscillospiraceae bacterium]|nr:hypothetical protein [Oscillospiraceae bacterium]
MKKIISFALVSVMIVLLTACIPEAVKKLDKMPVIEFSIDGIFFDESDLSVAKSTYSSRTDYMSNHMGPYDDAGNWMPEDDTVYSMPYADSGDPDMEMMFGYWFIQPFVSSSIQHMGTRTDGFLILGKYRIGDNATQLINDLTGMADVRDIPDGYTVLFDDGTDKITINKRGNDAVFLRCIVGSKGLEITIENNLIIMVRMSKDIV